MTSVRTILVPVDFTDGSLAAVAHARALATVFKSAVHLLHVSRGPEAPAWAVELFGHHLRPIQESHRLNALDRLAAVIVAQQLDPALTTGLVRTGCPELVIAGYADEIRADLIVMGIHGSHDAPTHSVGHVVERVLGSVRCPVLAVPEPRPPIEGAPAQSVAIAC